MAELVQTSLEASCSSYWFFVSSFYVVDVIEVEDGEGVLHFLPRERGRRGRGGNHLGISRKRGGVLTKVILP